MWKEYATPLRFKLGNASWLSITVWLGHILAGLCLIPVELELQWKVIIWVAIAASLWLCSWRLSLFVTGNSLVEMIWREEDAWTFISRGGVATDVTMRTAWYAQRYLVILHFTGSRHSTVVLSEGRVGKEAFRKLRVRLRITAS